MNYVRDSRSPAPRSLQTSRVMSANRAKGSKPELLLRRELNRVGIRQYRLSPKSVLGRPDIAFIGKRVAVFVHGCYWHHCPKCGFPIPKHNRVFWKAKFKRNKERDERKESELRKLGWIVVVLWEHEIKANAVKAAQKVVKVLRKVEVHK